MPGPIPPPTKLDSSQVLQHAYDESTAALRVNTGATINVQGILEVAIDATTDSIKIGDGTEYVDVTVDNCLKVKDPDAIAILSDIDAKLGAPFTTVVFNAFNEISSVAIGAEQTILSYTVPVGKTLSLAFITAESDSVSIIRVKQNGTTIAKERIAIASEYNVNMSFQTDNNVCVEFAAGTVITVTGFNASTRGAAEFSARLVGYLE